MLLNSVSKFSLFSNLSSLIFCVPISLKYCQRTIEDKNLTVVKKTVFERLHPNEPNN